MSNGAELGQRLIDAKNAMLNSYFADLENISDDIVKMMENKLAEHKDTGHLIESLHKTSETTGNEIDIKIYADARNDSKGTEQKNGAMYAEFLEYGSGKYASDGAGATEKWVYYYDGDKYPKGFRTTHGYKAHPFITPAFDANIGKLNGAKAELDIRKYMK